MPGFEDLEVWKRAVELPAAHLWLQTAGRTHAPIEAGCFAGV